MDEWNHRWLSIIRPWATDQMAGADSGHGIDHVQRVVLNVARLGAQEGINDAIAMPAAWLHDCVCVPKNSPLRSMASTIAADKAKAFLIAIDYPSHWIDDVHHCIQAHSFSANIPCSTIEAKVVQDADRLEAIGAIGIARCLMTGGAMRQRLCHPEEPFPISRETRDNEQSIDHFYAKLLGLHRTMQTRAGQIEAERRTHFLIDFLRQFASEIDSDFKTFEQSMQNWENQNKPKGN